MKRSNSWPNRWGIALAVVLVGPLLSRAVAEPVPIRLDLTASGGGQTTGGTVNQPSGTMVGTAFFASGNLTGDGWNLDWAVDGNTDPVVNGVFSVVNELSVPQEFNLQVVMPVDPIFPFSLTGGSISGTVSDTNGNGATLTTLFNTALYTSKIDGNAFRTLYDDPTTFVAGGFDTIAIPAVSFGNPIPSQLGPLVNSSIGIDLNFTLSPGDRAAFTSVFVAEVPEPGTWLLLVLGAVGVALASRRRG